MTNRILFLALCVHIAAGVLCLQAGQPAATADAAEAGDVGHVAWEVVPSDPAWSALTDNGQQFGAYRQDTGEYATIDPMTGRWVRSQERAYCFRDAEQAILLARNPGVNWRRVQKETPGYRIGSRIVSEAEAMAELKPQPKLPDDSAMPSLTIIGTRAERAAVEQAIRSDSTLRAIAKSVLVQSYDPDDVMVAKYGFVTTGRPSIYMTAPSGKVLFRAEEYPGVDTLAAAIAAGVDDCCPPRKPKPDYDPVRDPDPIRIIHNQTKWWHWAMAAMGGVLGTVLLAGAVIVVVAAVYFVVVRLTGKPAPTPPAVVPVDPPRPGV